MLERIVASAKSGRLSALVGSGVSMEPPASAPSWRQLRDEVLDAIVALLAEEVGEGNNLLSIHNELKNSPISPELLFEAIDRFGGMSNVLRFAEVVNAGQPNYAHNALSVLGCAGALRHIVTANWDTYLEEALRANNPFRIIKDDRDLESIPKNSRWALQGNLPRWLLHLHGSLGSDFIQGGLYRLGFALVPKVDECLRIVLAQSDLLVLGYSGNDYDVFPSLREHFQNCNHNLFWVYRESDGLGENLLNLAQAFPTRVHLMGMDLHLALAEICERLNLTVGSNPAVVVPRGEMTLRKAARELGYISCYLSLSFLCASLGCWNYAMLMAEAATDTAYSERLFPGQTPHDLVSEACRYEAACAACAKEFDYADFLLREARMESNQMGKSFAEAAKNILVLDLQQGLIDLCKGEITMAESRFMKVLQGILADRTLSRIQGALSREGDWPMLNAAAVLALGTAMAMNESSLADAIVVNQEAYVTQIKVRNTWGACASLLSLALCYYRGGRHDEAKMALNDCLELAVGVGNLICRVAAQMNLDLVKSRKKSSPNKIVPIVDSTTGWHLVIDPFALLVRWQVED